MTETLQDRLRHGAKNIHSIGPDRAADLLSEAASAADLLSEAASAVDGLLPSARASVDAWAEREDQAWRDWAATWMRWPSVPNPDDRKLSSSGMREFIEERLMREMRLEKMLNDIRALCEEALGRTPDPARSTMQVVRDLCAYHYADRTYRANMEDPPVGLEPHETFWGGNVATLDAVAEHIRAHGGDPNNATLAQIAEAMTATDPNFTYKPNAAGNGLDATPVQRAGAGGAIEIVGGDPETIAALGLPERRSALNDPEARARFVADVQGFMAQRGTQPPPHPKAAEFQKLIDDLRGGNQPVEEAPHPRADELDALIAGLRDKIGKDARNTPETRARILASVADFMASKEAAKPAPSVTLDEAASDLPSDLPNGLMAFKVRVSPEIAATIERCREEYMTPEEEAEAIAQAARED